MEHKEKRGAVMHVGSSAGQVICASSAATLLWYCFDDRLATLTGVAALGSLAWTLVLPLLLALGAMLSIAGTNWSES